jgi:hypothetical protein
MMCDEAAGEPLLPNETDDRYPYRLWSRRASACMTFRQYLDSFSPGEEVRYGGPHCAWVVRAADAAPELQWLPAPGARDGPGGSTAMRSHVGFYGDGEAGSFMMGTGVRIDVRIRDGPRSAICADGPPRVIEFAVKGFCRDRYWLRLPG